VLKAQRRSKRSKRKKVRESRGIRHREAAFKATGETVALKAASLWRVPLGK